MRCAECREALSARLDGEQPAGERAAVDAHLHGCADCRRYAERAALVTRLARTALVEPVRDLSDLVHLSAPRPRRVRWEPGLRLLLGVIGIGQLGLAIGGMRAAGAAHGQASLSGATLAHFSHESSAWNLALAVGFLYVAARTRRGSGLIPLVGAFVGVLTALSVVDLAHARVDPSRLLSHGLVVLGLLVLIALRRLHGRPVDATPARAERFPRTAASHPPQPTDRDERPGQNPGLEPTARHRAA